MAGGLWRLVTTRTRDAVPRGVLATEEAAASWRTERLGVGIGKPHRPGGEAIHVRRFVVLRAVCSAVHPAHVIDKEDNDVGAARRVRFLAERAIAKQAAK